MRHLYCHLLLLVLLIGGLMVCRDAAAQSQPPNNALAAAGPPRKQDEVYLVNTRELDEPDDDDDDPVHLPMLRYNEQGKWESLDIDTFCRDSQTDVPTLVYVHGYDFDEQKAEDAGWAVYHAVCGDLPAQQRVRFIIWSWPSVAKRFRPARDLINKSRRADAEAYWLAWLLARLPSEARVGLVGSALGCRAIEGALHLAGGGELDDWRVARPDGQAGPPIRAVFVSPAIHDDWLYPGEMHAAALSSCGKSAAAEQFAGRHAAAL